MRAGRSLHRWSRPCLARWRATVHVAAPSYRSCYPAHGAATLVTVRVRLRSRFSEQWALRLCRQDTLLAEGKNCHPAIGAPPGGAGGSVRARRCHSCHGPAPLLRLLRCRPTGWSAPGFWYPTRICCCACAHAPCPSCLKFLLKHLGLPIARDHKVLCARANTAVF